jgi:hypothetical protein
MTTTHTSSPKAPVFDQPSNLPLKVLLLGQVDVLRLASSTAGAGAVDAGTGVGWAGDGRGRGRRWVWANSWHPADSQTSITHDQQPLSRRKQASCLQGK